MPRPRLTFEAARATHYRRFHPTTKAVDFPAPEIVNRRLGLLGFGSTESDAYTLDDMQFIAKIGSQVALAIDNALTMESVHAYQEELARSNTRLQLLLEINTTQKLRSRGEA